jgi:DNA-binding CsgD family transcriptional regulator
MTELAVLSPGERRVFDEALLGLSVREIAERLVLTEATVKTHLAHIYGKLGVRGRVDLLARLRQEPDDPPSPDVRPPIPHRAPRRILKGGTLPLLLAVVLVLASAAIALVTSGPKAATLGDIHRLLAAATVKDLELAGSTLVATTDSSVRYEVRGVTTDQIRPDALERGVTYSEVQERGTLPALLLILWSLTPYGVMAGVIWLLTALIRHHGVGPRPAAAT